MLYAGATSWDQVDAIGTDTQVPTPDATNGVAAGFDFDLSSAALTYFLPGSGATPASPGQAWLMLSASALPYMATAGDNVGSNEDYRQSLAPADLTLTLTGAKPVPASVTGQGGPADETGSGILGGTYYWQVPASTRSAVMRVHLPAELAARPGYYGDHWGSVTQVPVRGIVSPVHLAFAASYIPPPVPPHDPSPWDLTTSKSETGGRSSSSGGRGHLTASGADGGGGSSELVPVGVAVVALALVALAVVASPRRLPGLARARVADPAEQRSAALSDLVASTGMSGARHPPEASGKRSALSGERGPDVEVALFPAEEPSLAGVPVDELGPSVAETPPQPTENEVPPGTLSLPEAVAIPTGPPALPPGTPEVMFLGTVELVGVVGTAKKLGPSELETLIFIAERPQDCATGESLRAALDAGRPTERSPETIRNYINDIRRALGADHLPDAKKSGGYRLVGVSTDAERLRDLVAKAGADPANAMGRLADALALVRGASFAGVPAGSYEWAFQGPTASGLANCVHSAATTLARLSLDAGNVELANWAVAQGALVWPTDQALAQLELQAAARTDRPTLARTWAAITRRLAAHDEVVSAELSEYYLDLSTDRLRPGRA